MDLREKRKREQEELKEQRKEEVVEAAVEVFKKHGIENAKMTDIAVEAKVGVASVYRYFKTKPDLAIEAATMFWRKEIGKLYSCYTNEAFLKMRGIDKVKEILEVFLKLYEDHQDFVSFIYEFDNYIIREKISREKLNDYEKNIVNLEPVLLNAIDSGKKDGTIRKDLIGEQFYFSVTHALMSLCQKLVLRGNVLESDQYVDGEEQIRTIIDMAVQYIKF